MKNLEETGKKDEELSWGWKRWLKMAFLTVGLKSVLNLKQICSK